MFQTSRQTSRSKTDLTEEIGVISAPTCVTHNTGIKAEEDGAIKGTLHSQREIYHFVGSILLMDWLHQAQTARQNCTR